MRFYLLSILFFGFCTLPWYRQLPTPPNGEMRGVWVKKTNPRSPLNSPWYKNTWGEEIMFDFPKKGLFIKTFYSRDRFGELLEERIVIGNGEYFRSTNWVLLHTKSIQKIEKKGEMVVKRTESTYNHRLLYYYDEHSKYIIPMLYDRAYEEENFGVKDGATKPYDEGKNFRVFINTFKSKDYQPHAYYLSDVSN